MSERQRMDADIVCVGFGPATAGFLTTLSKSLVNPDGTPAVESSVVPGMPPQVLCYERADDIGFGVSGIVTKARGLRATFPDLDPKQIPMATPVTEEKVLYLLDPLGASRRSWALRAADASIRAFSGLLPLKDDALELPWTPAFLHKQGGLVLSMGQFMQWVGAQIQSTGTVQIWPGTPVTQALVEGNKVVGVRLQDQGVDKQGKAGEGFMPGMDIYAALTVIGDGPVGAIRIARRTSYA
jgi:electron-transferring-flavoprotein dehydrogenase